jgi:hypothetical protein
MPIKATLCQLDTASRAFELRAWNLHKKPQRLKRSRTPTYVNALMGAPLGCGAHIEMMGHIGKAF